MKRRRLVPVAAVALLVSACTGNTDPGNDREAELSPPEPPADVASLAAVTAGVEADLLVPQTLTRADLGNVPEGANQCLFRFTRVGFPIFSYGATGALKLNGKLVPLPSAGNGRYAAEGLTVTVQPLGDRPAAAEPFVAELVLRLPGADHELGYHGFSECAGERGA